MSTLSGRRRPVLRVRSEAARRRDVEEPDRAVRRALQGLLLLAGFPLAGSLAVAALAVADYLVIRSAVAAGNDEPGLHLSGTTSVTMLKVLIPATLLIIGGLGWGLLKAVRTRNPPPAGTLVTASAEPELWDRVRGLAAEIGTRCPAEIRIGPEPVAEVSERSHLFGLMPGRRRLLVGAPLLTAFSERQLDAVLAHELAHFAHLDTRWGPVVARGRSAVLSALTLVSAHQRDVRPHRFRPRILRSPGDGERLALVAVQSYARLLLSLTEAVSRRQEYAADLVGARIVGRRNAINALTLLPVVEACHALYRERFVQGGLAVGLEPTAAASGAGFGAMMSEPEYSAVMERARHALPEKEHASAYDSHPPLYDRVAVLRSLPDDGRPEDDWSAPRAVTLLRDPSGVMTAAASAAPGKRPSSSAADGNRFVDWDTLVNTVARRRAAVTAEPLAAAVASMKGVARAVPEDLLDLVDAGRLRDLLAWVPVSGPDAGPPGAAAADRDPAAVAALVRAWVLGTLADRGTLGWRHSWSSFAALDAPAGTARRIGRACGALLAENPDTAPLRDILAAGRTS